MPMETVLEKYQRDYDDPIQRGILYKSCCRQYREKLHANRKSNVIHGCIIAVSLTIIAFAVLFHLAKNVDIATQIGATASQFNLRHNVTEYLSTIFDFSPKEQPSEFYCDQKLDITMIFRNIRDNVLNQNDALAKLEHAMGSDERFKAIALVGTSGIGKSMTTTLLQTHFPWKENVHIYSWSTKVSDEVHKFHLVRNFVEQLSTCGQNLLIIDNLMACDYGIVSILNEFIRNREGNSAIAATQNVVVIYIFNLEKEHYWAQFELLQELPRNTVIITYRPFGLDDLADCLLYQLKSERRVMDNEVFAKVLSEIDVYKTGCKNVFKKVITQSDPIPI